MYLTGVSGVWNISMIPMMMMMAIGVRIHTHTHTRNE